jgi:lipoprotein-releasing system ATP-binding protein
MAVLEARSLRKEYPGREGALVVLREASLHLESGDAVAIMGPSGSGKSTLLNLLGALERPTSGGLTLDGEDPSTLSDDALARFRNRKIGFVFQEHHLLPQLDVLENVLVATLPEGVTPDKEQRARKLLERVGLGERLSHRPAELSGGERQRAAIARALINHPSLVLADEPTGNLDGKTASGIADLLVELHAEGETILVIVTHSLDLAGRFPRRLELEDGRLVEAGMRETGA